jgi:hypothetical protein
MDTLQATGAIQFATVVEAKRAGLRAPPRLERSRSTHERSVEAVSAYLQRLTPAIPSLGGEMTEEFANPISFSADPDN